jgi:hypothetical protein
MTPTTTKMMPRVHRIEIPSNHPTTNRIMPRTITMSPGAESSSIRQNRCVTTRVRYSVQENVGSFSVRRYPVQH